MRLFLAVRPPEDVVAELMSLRRKDQRGVRFVRPEQWHVTLRFLGDADIDEVEHAMEHVALPPATAELGPAVDVLGERVLVVPVRGLEPLGAAIVAATRHLGEPPPRRRSADHLTLARLQRGTRPPPAFGALVSGRFEVDEVELVRSRLDPAGARHDVVATWRVPG